MHNSTGTSTGISTGRVAGASRSGSAPATRCEYGWLKADRARVPADPRADRRKAERLAWEG
jgi:hypothetical protein